MINWEMGTPHKNLEFFGSALCCLEIEHYFFQHTYFYGKLDLMLSESDNKARHTHYRAKRRELRLFVSQASRVTLRFVFVLGGQFLKT